MTTLFEKLGGAPAVDAAVDIFYAKVLADARITHFFATTDMARQRQHQKAFLTFACGAAPGYHGRSMRAAHQGLVDKLGLGEGHFDAVLENLATPLKELGVSDELIDEVALVAESIKDEVRCRCSGPGAHARARQGAEDSDARNPASMARTARWASSPISRLTRSRSTVSSGRPRSTTSRPVNFPPIRLRRNASASPSRPSRPRASAARAACLCAGIGKRSRTR